MTAMPFPYFPTPEKIPFLLFFFPLDTQSKVEGARAEGCMALGVIKISVSNDPLGAPGDTPCSLAVACGALLRSTLILPSISWDLYGKILLQRNYKLV